MRSTIMTAALLGAVGLSAGAVSAQSKPTVSSIMVTRGEFSVTPLGGYLVSQKFVEGPLNSSLGVVNAPLYGVQASLPLAPSASLVGTLGYASGDLEVGIPIRAAFRSVAAIPGCSMPRSSCDSTAGSKAANASFPSPRSAAAHCGVRFRLPA